MSQPRAIVPDKGNRSAKNGTGTDIGANLVVSWDSTLGQVVLPASAAAAMAGVSIEPIIDDNDVYYSIQKEGMAICTANAAIAVGALVMPATTGKVATRTGTNSIVGTALTAATADADLIEVDLLLQVGA